ncbi:MAG TPA: thymidine kinase [Bacteriovoracaceae bacterium]|nr:thymidine kinase [Bacteriovoracaceae bacterium]
MTHQYFHGSVEVICGPMFSGKTEELIRRVKRAQIAKQRVQIFKPAIDVRYDKEDVVSHNSNAIKAEPVENAVDILIRLKDSTRIVAIDEVQFFDDAIITVVTKLAARGYRIICAGLDLDYRAQVFGPMGTLLALADEVVKIHAICTVCGAPATRSQRLTNDKQRFLLGEHDAYEARCRGHYQYDDHEEQGLLPLEEEIKPLAGQLTN